MKVATTLATATTAIAMVIKMSDTNTGNNRSGDYKHIHEPELVNKLFKMYKQVLTQRIKFLKLKQKKTFSSSYSLYKHHQDQCLVKIYSIVRNYNSPSYRKFVNSKKI